MVCDLDLICMKLVSFRKKDYKDLIGLLNDCPYVTQDMVAQRLYYLYDKIPADVLSIPAIEFVRLNVRRI